MSDSKVVKLPVTRSPKMVDFDSHVDNVCIPGVSKIKGIDQHTVDTIIQDYRRLIEPVLQDHKKNVLPVNERDQLATEQIEFVTNVQGLIDKLLSELFMMKVGYELEIRGLNQVESMSSNIIKTMSKMIYLLEKKVESSS